MNSHRKALFDASEMSQTGEDTEVITPATLEDSRDSSPQFKGKRAVAIVYSVYPEDPRPRRAAEALAREGANVEVICLKETDEELGWEIFNGVQVTRVSQTRRRGGKFSYVFRYASFILTAAVIVGSRAFRRRYDLVHVHNMPDVLVFSAIIPKLLGAKVILDLHDPMPELMETIFGFRADSFPVRVLKNLEALSLRFADAVITVNTTCKRIFSTRSCAPDKIAVIMNSPDEAIFQHRETPAQVTAPRNGADPFVIMYHGSLVERHGLDLAVAAVQKVRKTIPGLELRIYGRSTPFLQEVMDQVSKSGLSDVVRYLGPKRLEEIPEAIGECDIGVIPNRRSRFTEINTPTRIFEYLSQGKPVIVPRTVGILDYFGPGELVLFDLGSVDDLAAKIEYAFTHPREVHGCVKRGQEVYLAHTWTRERQRFLQLIRQLVDPGKRSVDQIRKRPVSALETRK
jgi:glycosyltransferase involved in cell wall biosynthesis